MKRFFALVLLFSFVATPLVNAAPKKIGVKEMQLLTTIGSPNQVSGVVVSGASIIIYGTKESTAYARAIDRAGVELWSLSLDQSVSSVATTAVVDALGDIWIAGATSLTSAVVAPDSVPIPLNPDNASLPSSTLIGDLRTINLWKISSVGVLTSTSSLPTNSAVLPRAVAIDKNGLSITGILGNQKGSAGFLLNADITGSFSKLLQIGVRSTELDAVVRHTDGSITLLGSSSETLGGKKVAGVMDGVLIKLSKLQKITLVVRSSAAKAKRTWSSASSVLLLGGELVIAGKVQATITKFSSNFVPSWTYRFPSVSPAIILGSTHALFISTAPTPQLNWNPKSPTPLLLTFNAKGVVTAADSGPAGQKEVLGALLSKELGLLVVTASPESVSIFTLIPR